MAEQLAELNGAKEKPVYIFERVAGTNNSGSIDYKKNDTRRRRLFT